MLSLRDLIVAKPRHADLRGDDQGARRGRRARRPGRGRRRSSPATTCSPCRSSTTRASSRASSRSTTRSTRSCRPAGSGGCRACSRGAAGDVERVDSRRRAPSRPVRRRFGPASTLRRRRWRCSGRASSAASPTTTPAASRPTRSPARSSATTCCGCSSSTQIALFVTQEIGARIGLATGQGLTGLIRERFGVRWAAFAALTMIVANLGSTVSEFAGISAALSLFGVPGAGQRAPRGRRRDHADQPRAASAASSTSSSAIGVLVSAAYIDLGRPGPSGLAAALRTRCSSRTARSTARTCSPSSAPSGTTITPWGQGFIQAYVVDKRLRPEDLPAERIDVLIGVFITNVIARVHRHRLRGDAVGERAARHHGRRQTPRQALGPLAGNVASTLFAVGLLAASLLGLGVVPLAAPTRRARRSAGSRASTGAGARRRRSTACWRSSSASPRCSCSSRACR